MKKEDKKETHSKPSDNSFGVSSVILGILSIIFASLNGIILGVIALVFASKQQNRSPNVWGRRGKILAVIGLILSIIVIALNIWAFSNPEFLDQLISNQNAI